MKKPYQRPTNRIMRLIFDICHQKSIVLEERYTKLVQIVLQFLSFPLLNICLCQLLYVCSVCLFRFRQISPVKPHFFLSPARLLNQMQFVFAFSEGSESRQRITCPILHSYIAQTNSNKWETQLFCQIHIRCWKICSIELISLPPLYLADASHRIQWWKQVPSYENERTPIPLGNNQKIVYSTWLAYEIEKKMKKHHIETHSIAEKRCKNSAFFFFSATILCSI